MILIISLDGILNITALVNKFSNMKFNTASFQWFVAGIISFHVFLVSAPICIVIALICFCLMYLAFFCSMIRYGKSISRAKGMDAINGMESEISRPYINIAMRFPIATPDIDEFRQRFQNTVLVRKKKDGEEEFSKFKRLFKRSFGYFIWVESVNFDLKNHIKMLDPKKIKSKYLENFCDKHSEVIKDHTDSSDLSNISWETILYYVLSEVGAKPINEYLPKWEVLILPEHSNG